MDADINKEQKILKCGYSEQIKKGICGDERMPKTQLKTKETATVTNS